ncbi:hypothetical protein ON010_g8776 [Phytophthora cinnamomi]|nr:hypothetical protein ON010_g8776 [Phytophthora cinnamomi]
MAPKYTQEALYSAVAKVLDGASATAVAETSTISVTTIRKWARNAKNGVTRQRRGPIPQLPARETSELVAGRAVTDGWYTRFVDRHPDLSNRAAQALSKTCNTVESENIRVLFNSMAKVTIDTGSTAHHLGKAMKEKGRRRFTIQLNDARSSEAVKDGRLGEVAINQSDQWLPDLGLGYAGKPRAGETYEGAQRTTGSAECDRDRARSAVDRVRLLIKHTDRGRSPIGIHVWGNSRSAYGFGQIADRLRMRNIWKRAVTRTQSTSSCRIGTGMVYCRETQAKHKSELNLHPRAKVPSNSSDLGELHWPRHQDKWEALDRPELFAWSAIVSPLTELDPDIGRGNQLKERKKERNAHEKATTGPDQLQATRSELKTPDRDT